MSTGLVARSRACPDLLLFFEKEIFSELFSRCFHWMITIILSAETRLIIFIISQFYAMRETQLKLFHVRLFRMFSFCARYLTFPHTCWWHFRILRVFQFHLSSHQLCSLRFIFHALTNISYIICNLIRGVSMFIFHTRAWANNVRVMGSKMFPIIRAQCFLFLCAACSLAGQQIESHNIYARLFCFLSSSIFLYSDLYFCYTQQWI